MSGNFRQVNPLGLHKLAAAALYGLGYLVFYLYPNFFPIWEPIFLPMLRIDETVPFLPWTFLVYTSDYLLILCVIVFTTREEFNHFARMAFGVLFLCGLFFIFFPTTYPRPVYPDVSNPLVAGAMQLVAMADNPTNCFPSQHVALTGICAWSMRGRGRLVHGFFWLWALAIFASTMTTKQHYLYDIFGGVAVSATIAALERVFFEKKLFFTLFARAKVATK